MEDYDSDDLQQMFDGDSSGDDDTEVGALPAEAQPDMAAISAAIAAGSQEPATVATVARLAAHPGECEAPSGYA